MGTEFFWFYDVILAAILIGMMFIGAKKGFVRMVLRLCAFAASFVIALMIMAEFLLIHSRIQAEKEENSRVVCSLRMLGMIDKEMVKCLCYKNFLRFIPPSVVGTILSFLPSYYLNESYGMGTNGILAGIVFGVILTVGIFVVIRRYSEKEEKLYESGFIIQGRGFFDYR